MSQSVAIVSPRLGETWIRTIEQGLKRFAERKRLSLVAIALLAILGLVALLWLIPVPAPAVHDEFSYLLAGDTFAHGRLSNPPHPMWFFFDTFHVEQHPSYASIFPPAQGGMLALGQLLGHPWIGVLFSMALMCTAMTWMLQGWFPAEWALLGGVIVLVRFAFFSYWINSYWGGAIAATGGAMVLGAFPRIIHYKRWRDATVFGIGAGLLANSRPLEGFIFCIPVAAALVIWHFSERIPARVTGRQILLPFLAVMLLVLAFIGYYNRRVTGSALLLPHALSLRQQCNCPVFAWQNFRPPQQYANAQFDYFYNVKLPSKYIQSWEGWMHRTWAGARTWWHIFLGSFLSIPFLTLPWLIRDRRMRLPLVQFCLSAIGLAMVTWFEPHYAAPMLAALLVLLVQAFRYLRKWSFYERPVGLWLSRAVVLVVLANIPLYIVQTIRHRPTREAWSVSRARIVKQLEGAPDRNLVIVRYTERHSVDDEWVYNSADIDHSKFVWAREIPGQNPQPLLDYFRDRKVWLVEADASPPQYRPYTALEIQTK